MGCLWTSLSGLIECPFTLQPHSKNNVVKNTAREFIRGSMGAPEVAINNCFTYSQSVSSFFKIFGKHVSTVWTHLYLLKCISKLFLLSSSWLWKELESTQTLHYFWVFCSSTNSWCYLESHSVILLHCYSRVPSKIYAPVEMTFLRFENNL